MKPTKNSVLSFFRLFVMAAVMFIFSTPAFAYEEDTHFTMTYVICRSVGFTPDEALIVASVDQGMDDSPGTVANGGVGGVVPNVEEEWLWHALDGYGYTNGGSMKTSGVLARRDKFFQDALNETTLRNKLIRLGVFFHYQQDTWAHRHHYDDNHLSRDAYTTYNTPVGHALYGHQPDRPPFDPVAALMNLEDGVVYARRFLKEGLGREPNPFLANYKPQGGREDDGWTDSKKGKYFHQIDWSGAPAKSDRRYLLSLIREQINIYTTSFDANPMFTPCSTANEANVKSVGLALEKVWNEFNPYREVKSAYRTIDIPTTAKKNEQGFTSLTSAMLNAPLPDAPQFVGVGTNNLLNTKASLKSPWVQAPKFGLVGSVAVMKNGTILGVGTDNFFYKRANLNSPWELVSSTRKFIDIAVMKDGKILGVGTDNQLWTKLTLDSDWVQAPKFGSVISAGVMPDGTILGVGTDKFLYTQANLDSPWLPTLNTGLMMAVTVMQDEMILTVGADNWLYTRPTVNNWFTQVPNTWPTLDVAEMPLAK